MRQIVSPLDGFASPFGVASTGLRFLFANGEAGAWYDPSDLSTLFQDAAGAVPVTADGDPVGLMLDTSGNGYHASQAVSASRPTYRTAFGYHWLEFDGVDDILVVASAANHTFATMVVGYVMTAAAQNGPYVFGPGITTTGQFSLYSSFGRARFIRQPQTGTTISATGDLNDTAQVSSARVGPGVDDFLAQSNQSSMAWAGSGAQEMDLSSYGIRIGGRNPGSAHAEMNFYGGVYVHRAISDDELARAEAFMARKTGVAL